MSRLSQNTKVERDGDGAGSGGLPCSSARGADARTGGVDD